mmetsp:Transcript_14901/g.44144  ORF Transcript_14901/g.44144 Transcript_14901/m.44144 type:complete len:263 (-) Transcript_14901:575-1363(-)
MFIAHGDHVVGSRVIHLGLVPEELEGHERNDCRRHADQNHERRDLHHQKDGIEAAHGPGGGETNLDAPPVEAVVGIRRVRAPWELAVDKVGAKVVVPTIAEDVQRGKDRTVRIGHTAPVDEAQLDLHSCKPIGRDLIRVDGGRIGLHGQIVRLVEIRNPDVIENLLDGEPHDVVSTGGAASLKIVSQVTVRVVLGLPRSELAPLFAQEGADVRPAVFVDLYRVGSVQGEALHTNWHLVRHTITRATAIALVDEVWLVAGAVR